ncbi:CPBP family intramembrane metalloprotease [Nocardioides sp. zg-ZUI104]|uniref:CPBP family intramembrane glutamic endopeptidase n=1 Tax=Nocardioides faecalis TaxID=2803858 RepID=UPI001BCD7ECE|nr:CPBP family intramembrane glutamic endopeptidase [Nocardioides faecalis]MBS4753252.1 CPBP family intramembrane metalloprotease [Nocardioides faecalis]
MKGSEAAEAPAAEADQQDVWWLTRTRRLLALMLAALVILLVYGGPPVDDFAGIDLRFGLSGPLAGDPWKWAGAALLLVIVLRVERLSLTSLLLRKPSARDLEWVMYAFGVFMVWSWTLGMLAPQEDNDGISTIARLGVLGVLVLIVTAAVTEEIVYRGFLAERLGALFGRRQGARWLGAALSLAIFVAPHVHFFGPSWLVHQLPGTLAVAAVALLRRNLVAAMLLHLLINLPILIPTVLEG